MAKVILQNRPYENANAQYNFNNQLGLLGAPPDVNIVDKTLELYSVVESKVVNIDSNSEDFISGGVMWNYMGSKIEFYEVDTVDGNMETDGGRYVGVKFAIYMYDESDNSTEHSLSSEDYTSNDTGNTIRDNIIQKGNGFDDNGVRVGYWSLSEQKQDRTIGNIINENNACYGTCGPNWNSDLTIRDFPKFPRTTANIFYEGARFNWNTDLVNWTKKLSTETDSFFIVLRGAGDERETIFPFGTKTDERDRVYTLLEFKKNHLRTPWKASLGEVIKYGWGNPAGSEETVSTGIQLWNKRDRYGDSNGHNSWGDQTGPINTFQTCGIEITYPKWTPEKAALPKSQGGWNSKWANIFDNANTWWAVKGVGLNPSYDIDYYNWPNNFYNTSFGQKWFKEELVLDWRPISNIVTTYSNSSFDKDIQSYYPAGTLDSVYASAPNNVRLQFDFTPEPAQTGFNSELEVIDLANDTNYNDLKYWFMVVNWDWKDTDKGGGICEGDDASSTCLEELSTIFPESEEQLTSLHDKDLFKLASMTSSEGFNNYLDYQYIEPGIKIIKAIVFSTVDYNHFQETTEYSGKYRQAVRWKLVTIKINLTDDSFNDGDFSEVGGGDFTFLPYPEQIIYNGENDNPLQETPTGNYYKSSHPIISGISKDSVYVKDLEMLNQKSPSIFSEKEGAELRQLKKSLNNTTDGNNDELGKYIGNTDFSQVRFFEGEVIENYACTIDDINSTTIYSDKCQELENVQVGDTIEIYRTYDIYDFLDINPNIDNTFQYYNNFNYWNGDNQGFPIESSITDIFISGDKHLYNRCILELNCWNHSGGSILDSSGNGNKGILIGDYSIKKENKNKPAFRASSIELPKLDNNKKDGAF